LALAVLGAAAVVLSNQPAQSPPASPSAPPFPGAIGPLAIGEYAAPDFSPPFSLSVSDPGWSLYQNDGQTVGLYHDDNPRGWLDIAGIERLYTDACTPEGPSIPAGDSAFDLVEALRQVVFLEVGPAQPIEIGEKSGFSMDIGVIDGAQAACGSLSGAGISVLSLGEDDWQAQPGEHFRIVALDVDDHVVSFLQSVDSTISTTGSVSELQQFLDVADRIVQSVRF
jgi:hypothetical protein